MFSPLRWPGAAGLGIPAGDAPCRASLSPVPSKLTQTSEDKSSVLKLQAGSCEPVPMAVKLQRGRTEESWALGAGSWAMQGALLTVGVLLELGEFSGAERDPPPVTHLGAAAGPPATTLGAAWAHRHAGSRRHCEGHRGSGPVGSIALAVRLRASGQPRPERLAGTLLPAVGKKERMASVAPGLLPRQTNGLGRAHWSS